MSVKPPEYILPPQEELNKDLYKSAEDGDYKEVERLVIAGADIYSEEGPKGEQPLHAASGNGHEKIVDYLLYNGARVNAKDRFHQTPLHKASENGYLDVVRTIIKYKPDVNCRDKVLGYSPLQIAAWNGQIECAKALIIDGGANVEAKCRWVKKTALQLASERGHFEVMQAIVNSQSSEPLL